MSAKQKLPHYCDHCGEVIPEDRSRLCLLELTAFDQKNQPLLGDRSALELCSLACVVKWAYGQTERAAK